MKKNILPLILFIVSLTACDSDIPNPCIKGRYILYEHCRNAVVIEVLEGDLKGGSVNSSRNTGDNMVQFLTLPETIFTQMRADSLFYFNYRFFDFENDEYPVDDDVCTTNTFPFDIPTIVITNYSATNCPINNEN